MKKTIQLLLALSFCLLPATVSGQGLDPASILKASGNSWPTYAGDYSQRRFSPLTQLNTTTVHNLTLAWIGHLSAGPGGFGYPTITGGVAANPVTIPGSSEGEPHVSGSILEVNGILYISSPDNAWAMDAHDGTVLWHYFWKSRGATHIGNRGLALYHNWLYLETPDDVLVSLDARTGKERWHRDISDFDEQYFSTAAPVVVGNHVLVGTGDDLDAPGFVQSFDPETGALQWKFYTVPMTKDDPAAKTWSSLDAARHGGAMVWMPGSYDPETHLYIFGTGNPIPAYTDATRGHLPDLYTCSVVAVNVDTGKLAWYYQTSPDDTHDWDSTQAPVLFDGTFHGKPRKLVAQASRNGYFFVLDRVTGQHLLTSKFSGAANWAKEIDASGAVVREPSKDSTVAGSLVSPDNGGATNWPPPTYDPQTGLFYVVLRENYSEYYLTTKNPRLMVGLGGKEEDGVGTLGTSIAAIDYKTGKLAWKYRFPNINGGWGFSGLLTTAGHLLFANDTAGSLVAYDAANARPLWHARIGAPTNAAETYMLDGKQYVLVAVGPSIFAFSLQ